jgi:hypothetical protein
MEQDFEFLDPSEVWKYKSLVMSKINIVDLMVEYKIPLELKSSGQFSHRAKCPFHKGVNGKKEKIASFYISQETNSFYCFGPCDAHGTIIDFVSLMDGTPPIVALMKLAKKVGIINKNGQWDELQLDSYGSFVSEFDPNKTIEPYLFNISFLLRDYIRRFINNGLDDKLLKMEKFASKIDKAVSKLEYGDWEEAEKLFIKVKERLSK